MKDQIVINNQVEYDLIIKKGGLTATRLKKIKIALDEQVCMSKGSCAEKWNIRLYKF